MKNNHLVDLVAKLKAAEEDAYESASAGADCVAEIRSEAAAFGDAPVGSCDQLARIRKRNEALRSKVEAIRAMLPAVHTCRKPDIWETEEDCPF